MNQHGKKMIAPVIIVLIIVAYYSTLGAILMRSHAPVPLKIIITAFSMIISIIFIIVLRARIKEIRSGEEDDLGKY